MYAQRRDINEPEIVDALRRVGAYVQPMDKSAGFDLLVGFRGVLYAVEVKSTGGKVKTPAQLDAMLTPNELATKVSMVTIAGCTYHIVTDSAAALAAVGIGE